jgi:hypothetical protein
VTITLSNDANGVLSGTGLSADDGGVYTLTDTAAAITADLDGRDRRRLARPTHPRPPPSR